MSHNNSLVCVVLGAALTACGFLVYQNRELKDDNVVVNHSCLHQHTCCCATPKGYDAKYGEVFKKCDRFTTTDGYEMQKLCFEKGSHFCIPRNQVRPVVAHVTFPNGEFHELVSGVYSNSNFVMIEGSLWFRYNKRDPHRGIDLGGKMKVNGETRYGQIMLPKTGKVKMCSAS